MKIVLASNNADKLREIRSILSDTDIEVVSQKEAGCDFEAEENGTTFYENAKIKARAAMEATGLACVADDSGLEITALGGAPGVYSARYCGGRSYSEACQSLIDEIGSDQDRSARFVTNVVCIFPNGDEIAVEGEIKGSIAYKPEGSGGFGYDPIFIPEGYEKSMACLTDNEKNAISNRGRAFRAFADMLKRYNY